MKSRSDYSESILSRLEAMSKRLEVEGAYTDAMVAEQARRAIVELLNIAGGYVNQVLIVRHHVPEPQRGHLENEKAMAQETHNRYWDGEYDLSETWR